MKYIVFPILTLLLIFATFSCSSDDEDDNIGLDTSPNTIVANMEGNAWEAKIKEATLSNDILTVYGQAGNGSVIVLKMDLYKNQPVDKAYILANSASHFAVYDQTGPMDSLIYWTKNNSDALGQSGDILLTKLDKINKLVSGTFKFRAFNNHDNKDYYYFSQGAFTDVQIVDSLTIITGTNVNISSNTGGTGTGTGTGGNSNNTDVNYVNCDLNGAPIVSTSENITSPSGNFLIQASYGTQKTLSLQFPAGIAQGDYDLSTSSNNVVFTYVENGVVYSENPTGNLFIIENSSSTVSGNFYGTLKNENDSTDIVTLHGGTFSMSLLQ